MLRITIALLLGIALLALKCSGDAATLPAKFDQRIQRLLSMVGTNGIKNRAVAIGSFSTSTADGWAAKDGRPTDQKVAVPLTTMRSNPDRFCIDGTFAIVKEINGVPPKLDVVKQEFPIPARRWNGDPRGFSMAVLIPIQAGRNYFLAECEPGASDLSTIDFIGPLQADEIDDVADAVKFLIANPVNTLSRAQIDDLKASPNLWKQAIAGQTVPG